MAETKRHCWPFCHDWTRWKPAFYDTNYIGEWRVCTDCRSGEFKPAAHMFKFNLHWPEVHLK